MSKRLRTNHSRSISRGHRCRAQLPLAHEVDLGKGLNPWGFQRKLKPDDTNGMIAEQVALVTYVAAHQPVRLWKLFNALGRTAGPHKYQSRSFRQKLMPLATRLCREGILKRHRQTNTLSLGPNHATVTPDIAADGQDLCAPVCYVPVLGSSA